jgi:SAM-dependent methyltransferase
MSHDPERRALLARAWNEAAQEYERYFVPRFAPWVEAAVRVVAETRLPPGPILVPCCGTFPEVPALVGGHPAREIVGIDLSAEMVRLARERVAGWPRVRVVEGDAATLDGRWFKSCAAVVSVFGLQQLPDPEAALGNWVEALRPSGCLSVVYWPRRVEERGPFALLDEVLVDHRPPDDALWEARLGDAINDSMAGVGGGLDKLRAKSAQALTAAGGTVERDEYLSFPMNHPDAGTFWEAFTTGGPLRALAIARGEKVMLGLREEFIRLAPTGRWRHLPRARWIVARTKHL